MSLLNTVEYFFIQPLAVQLTAVFIFALLVGSFLNVVIYRLPIIIENDYQKAAREILEMPLVETKPFGLMYPRSKCRDCDHMIGALENIPIISYLFMRGKCRQCNAKISAIYPVVELLTACLAALAYWRLGGGIQGLFALFFVFALVALSGIDINSFLLPDQLTLPLMWAGIVLSFWAAYIPLNVAVLGAIVGYLSLFCIEMTYKLLFKKEGMGRGDAKLLAAIFAWVHIEYFPMVLILACFVGAAVTIIQRLFKGDQLMGQHLPFGPYLALAGYIAMLYGADIMAWYLPMIQP